MVIPIVVVERMCQVLLELLIVVPEVECRRIVADRTLSIDSPVFEVLEFLPSRFRVRTRFRPELDGEIEAGYTVNVLRSAGERV